PLSRLTDIITTIDHTVISSHEYSYNDANQRNRAELADGSYWEYSYDELGQVTGGVKKDSGGTPIPGYSFGYTFDDIGNRKTSVENSHTTTYAPNLLNQYTNINRPAIAHLRGDRGTTGQPTQIVIVWSGPFSYRTFKAHENPHHLAGLRRPDRSRRHHLELQRRRGPRLQAL
ncbi:MAG: hypothetical protein P5702_26185, partial [Limnospira sp. PMC 1291.21]|uniref:hypothetical protein n=1 Tax=Limnospira sp. PMC 1291.21 TaxID=2981074 RepID=UPI0028E1408A